MKESDSGGGFTLSGVDRVSHEKAVLGLRRNPKKEPQCKDLRPKGASRGGLARAKPPSMMKSWGVRGT